MDKEKYDEYLNAVKIVCNNCVKEDQLGKCFGCPVKSSSDTWKTKMEPLKKFYFTFGSNLGFPFPNSYLIVIATDKGTAIDKFRQKYPDRHPNTFNCSFVYSEEEWEGSLNQRCYLNKPAEIIQ